MFLLSVIMCVAVIGSLVACTPDDINAVIKDNTSKLSTPDGIYLDEDNVLRWNSVTNASSYVITIDEKDYERTTLACDLKKILKTNGTYEVFIRAKSNVATITDSDVSEGVKVNYTGGVDGSENGKTDKLFGQFDNVFTEEAYLGYGYDVIGSSYVNSREVKFNYPIFDLDKLKEQRLVMLNERDTLDEYISGDSMESYMSSLETKVNAKLKITKAFSGGARIV